MEDVIVSGSFDSSTGFSKSTIIIGHNMRVNPPSENMSEDVPTIYIGNESEIVRIGIIQSSTIEKLQKEIEELRKKMDDLLSMIEFHPDNEFEMAKRKAHFNSLIS